MNTPHEQAMMIPEEHDGLRHVHYNAHVCQIRRVHDDLMILRVVADQRLRPLLAGQYTTLGLAVSEPRADGVVHQVDSSVPAAIETPRLIRRAYSISCPIVDERGELTPIDELPFLEFYINFVHRPTDNPPMLTPRLFALGEGDRLYVGPRTHGHYTTEPIGAGDNVLFAATGTGEAPHNAMVIELLRAGHQGKIAVVTCARHRVDLAYLERHRILELRFPNYRYLPLTTREPQNTDPKRADYVGKLYLQDLFSSRRVLQEIGFSMDPARTRVFLCGSPAMIGLPHTTLDGEVHFPEPVGMVEVLIHQGFRLAGPHQPGNIYVERYW